MTLFKFPSIDISKENDLAVVNSCPLKLSSILSEITAR